MNDDNKRREEKPLIYGDEVYFEASLEIPPQKPEPPTPPVVDNNNSNNDE